MGSLGIAPTLSKFDSWSPGAGFIPIISINGINQIKKGNCKKKKNFIHTKRFIIFLRYGCNLTSTGDLSLGERLNFIMLLVVARGWFLLFYTTNIRLVKV